MTGDECKCEACQCEGTMIERVARAIGARIVSDDKGAPGRYELDYPLLYNPDSNSAVDLESVARAAIEAMREPTEAMAMAASEKLILACDFDNPSVDDIKGSYRASIDAALTEKGEG